MGDGLSASAVARAGSTVIQESSPIDAVQGNPAGLATLRGRTVELSAVMIVASGRFQGGHNQHARLRGVAGAIPYGAYAFPLGSSPYVFSVAFTPELLMKASWKYFDAPGKDGVSYGLQKQETQILALRSSIGAARTLGRSWRVGGTVGVVYNENSLAAPYIFQQQPVLRGLKVLVDLTTRGYGWNGSAGVQWHASPVLRTGLAWKSGTTLRTEGTLTGSASALFESLGVDAPSDLRYHASVLNHLPQAFSGGISWESRQYVTFIAEAGMTVWGQAFAKLPLILSDGSNATINSVVGSKSIEDSVPLRWNNQTILRAGIQYPINEEVIIGGGYSFRSNPVPNATLTPLTAAIMSHAIATGVGWGRGSWRSDIAYQIQLPSSESVSTSALQAGEYNNSKVGVSMQSVTISARKTF